MLFLEFGFSRVVFDMMCPHQFAWHVPVYYQEILKLQTEYSILLTDQVGTLYSRH